jgi:hypothetical protein
MSRTFHGLPAGHLSNGHVHLEYLLGAGPRIVHLSLGEGGENLMAELAHLDDIPTPYGPFKLYGGHRLWHAPEGMPRSYIPDNEGCVAETFDGGVTLTGGVEAATGIRKTVRIELAEGKAGVTVTHILTNEGLWTVELAPWALSQMRLGGVAFFPQTQGTLEPTGLLPSRNLVLWPYSRLSDPRLSLNDDYHFLLAQPDAHPVKIGYMNRAGWAGYLSGDVLFVKRWEPCPNSQHVDFGCNCESYCNDAFIEIETVGPLVRLQPGASTVHVEEWELFVAEGVERTLEGVRRLALQLDLG